MPAYTQENRIIQVFTPLGADVLLLQRFTGEEGISKLFHFDLYMHSENKSINFKSITGKKATIQINLPDLQPRYLNGIISSFSQAGSTPLEGGIQPKIFAHYHATLVPWTWMLTRTSDCRIFQDMPVPDIITKICKEHGFSDLSNRLHGTYKPREYCVQYRETDFNFISRLMEEEGIFYFFEHEADKHTLVMADSPSEIKQSQFHKDVSYKSIYGEKRRFDIIEEWTIGQEVRPGKYTINDFNFKQPLLDLTSGTEGKDPLKFEIYDYPGEYKTKDAGERYVNIRQEEEDTPIMVASGSSACRGFVPGYRFDLKDHYRRDLNQSYIITNVYHASDQGANYRTSDVDALAIFDYHNNFQCVPYPTRIRPMRVTPVPVVHGTQTAIVVGPPGEEIYVDQYSRVKVQFHWDREGKYNEKSSCWIRVSQNWAGKRWGIMFIPRIGQEVIVDFLEGDPDQPIIVGRVYNGDSMPPYPLPDEKTKSTIKSLSSKGGGGFNEIRYEDLKGKEQIFIHAERNEDIRINRDLYETIGRESHLLIGDDYFEEMRADKHIHIKSDHNEKVDGTISVQAGQDMELKVGSKYALDAGLEIHEKAGMNICIESGGQITLKVGGNFININQGGIIIVGNIVLINSGGSPGSGSGSHPESPKPPKEADKADAGEKSQLPPPKRPPKPAVYSSAAVVLRKAASLGTPFVNLA